MPHGLIPLLLAALHDPVMGSTLVKCAATDVGVQWAGWALASALRTEKFYDLAGNFSHKLLESADNHVLVCYSTKLICVKVSDVRVLATKQFRFLRLQMLTDNYFLPKQSDLSVILIKHVI